LWSWEPPKPPTAVFARRDRFDPGTILRPKSALFALKDFRLSGRANSPVTYLRGQPIANDLDESELRLLQRNGQVGTAQQLAELNSSQ
jgi:hypothetical protein